MTIRPAFKGDIPVIQKLAQETWWPTYRPILSEEQISLMLEKMYSETALSSQMDDGQQFALAENEGIAAAFCSFSFDPSKEVIKIHKLYVHPQAQGLGAGRKMISFIESACAKMPAITLELNVNRYNPALSFYEKLGFNIEREIDIPYYEFFLNDYVMRRPIGREQQGS